MSSFTTQTIPLPTAPLIAGRRDSSSDLLKPGAYKRLVRFLRDKQREPADLLVPDARELLEDCQQDVDDKLVEYTEGIGRLVASTKHTLVSGGARGIDQAAMRGALETGGKVRSDYEKGGTWAGAVEQLEKLHFVPKEWLQHLVKEGVLEKVSKPVRYCSTKVSGRLF